MTFSLPTSAITLCDIEQAMCHDNQAQATLNHLAMLGKITRREYRFPARVCGVEDFTCYQDMWIQYDDKLHPVDAMGFGRSKARAKAHCAADGFARLGQCSSYVLIPNTDPFPGLHFGVVLEGPGVAVITVGSHTHVIHVPLRSPASSMSPSVPPSPTSSDSSNTSASDSSDTSASDSSDTSAGDSSDTSAGDSSTTSASDDLPTHPQPHTDARLSPPLCGRALAVSQGVRFNTVRLLADDRKGSAFALLSVNLDVDEATGAILSVGMATTMWGLGERVEHFVSGEGDELACSRVCVAEALVNGRSEVVRSADLVGIVQQRVSLALRCPGGFVVLHTLADRMALEQAGIELDHARVLGTAEIQRSKDRKFSDKGVEALAARYGVRGEASGRSSWGSALSTLRVLEAMICGSSHGLMA